MEVSGSLGRCIKRPTIEILYDSPLSRLVISVVVFKKDVVTSIVLLVSKILYPVVYCRFIGVHETLTLVSPSCVRVRLRGADAAGRFWGENELNNTKFYLGLLDLMSHWTVFY